MGFPAGFAGDAAPDDLLAQLDVFHADAVFPENLLHLLKGQGDIAVRPRASVQHQYIHSVFHSVFSSFRLIFRKDCP